MRAPTPVLLAAFLCAPLVPAQEPPAGIERTAHFEIRFREGSRSEASVDRVASLVEAELARILGEVGLQEFPATIRLVLYDDVAELQRVTGARASGFSVPLCSHVPHDNDQTRVHELVHVVAERFAEKGPEQRNLFVAEGLANAVLRFVDGVHVDQVAAFHARRGDLPALAEVLGAKDFYAWIGAHPHVGAYDVAGSWLRFLLDTYGAAEVRAFYKGVPAQQAFGHDLAALEAQWHAHLDEVVLRPGTRRLLQQRLGRTPAERDPDAAALASVLEPASAWRRVAANELQDGGAAESDGDGAAFALPGEANVGDWCEAHFAVELGDAVVRCTAEPQARCYGVKLQLGDDCQAIVLRGQGAFLYRRGGAAAHDASVTLGDRVQLMLRRHGNRASVWVDGKLVLEGEVGAADAPLGVGCVGGPARFRELAVRGPAAAAERGRAPRSPRIGESKRPMRPRGPSLAASVPGIAGCARRPDCGGGAPRRHGSRARRSPRSGPHARAQDGRWPESALYGRIVSVLHDGVPAADVWVTDGTGAVVARTVADGDGHYQLRRLPSGPLRLFARGADLVQGSMAVAALGIVREATLVLEDGARLDGAVRWPDGSPAAGADVLVRCAAELPEPFAWWAETTADANGAWSLPCAPLRPLTVLAFVPGHALAEVAIGGGRDGLVSVAMPDGATTARRVAVRGAPAGLAVNVCCEVAPAGGSWSPAPRLPRRARQAVVGADGTAMLWPLPMPHEVRVEAAGHRSMPVSVPCRPGVERELQFTLSPLPADLVTPSTVLTGRLLDAIGSPLAGVTIAAVAEDRRSEPCVTAADGGFALDVPVRTKVLCRIAVLSRGWRLADERVEVGPEGLSWLTVAADPDRPLRLAAARAGAVRGTLRGPTGLPFAAARLQLRLAGAEQRLCTVVSATDAAGRLDVPGLAPGRYELLAVGADGREGTASIVVPEGGDAAPGELAFAAGAALSGVLKGPDGRPVPSAALTLVPLRAGAQGPAQLRVAPGPSVRVLADRAGRYRVPWLREGGWGVFAATDPRGGAFGRARRADSFEIAAGAPVELDLSVTR